MPTKIPDTAQSDKDAIEQASDKDVPKKTPKSVKEVGGPKGLEPTRYGDWERKGIVSDF
ncbi:MAG: DUF1674 domain-containing protein [Rhodospirillaceae bacterium]|jgi:hypothetical protein|nr:DUF1674 domain-containing protein [Rhodospirillaceae bacterium]MBT4046447.1 DUF1674 domain-containing protein [Rhodospirillaceae bacterium]MBT4690465.1 DUF1674 domain-containing protein [Rhodospirillaceae bacterium]MBT5083183.1 DUF1674 domain-containing protein [Rhodospirillaceae bacterium]MBT5526486.1 DUF1674 domain-containing protein [Rhodospirillaceae bacterium]